MNSLQALTNIQSAVLEGSRVLGQPGVVEHVLAVVRKNMNVPCTYVFAPYLYGSANQDKPHALAMQPPSPKKIEYHSGMPAQFFEDYASYVWQMDPWRDALATKMDRLMALGGVIGHQHIPHQAMYKTGFYQEYLKHEIGLESMMCASIGGGYWLGFMRGAHASEFHEVDLHFVNQFKNQLASFIHAHQQTLKLQAEQSYVWHALDRLTDGVLIVSLHGEIMMLNASASRYLGLPRKVSVQSPFKPTLLLPQIHRALWMLMQKARFQEKVHGCIDSPSYPPGLHASITWQTSPADTHQGCAYVELIGSNKLDVAIQVQKCVKRYGLSASEAAVLAGLIDQTPQEIANQLGLKLCTIRSHLASLFTKTNTRRQSELLWLLAGS